MRFLFTFTGGSGHFLPTLSIARALRQRGHDIAYACQEGMVERVAAEGLTAFPTGGRTLLDPSERRPLVQLDRAAEERVLHNFARRHARERTPRILDVAGSWQPDVIVRDEMDFGAAVAAESLGLPHASVVVLAAGGMLRGDLVADPLTALRADFGLGADPNVEMLHRYLTLVPVPPSYRDPRDILPSTAHHIRPAVLDTYPGDPSRVGTVAARRGRPLVYFTLGTIFHQESGDLFGRVLAGLAGLPIDVIVTVGHEIDPRELGEQPAHVRVERFLSMEELLPRCDAVVSHAGSGSVIASLAFGLPSVLLPMGADQPFNGDRCSELGVGRVLDALESTPEEIGAAVVEVLSERSYREAARRMQAEIVALPGPELATKLLERLAYERAPLERL